MYSFAEPEIFISWASDIPFLACGIPILVFILWYHSVGAQICIPLLGLRYVIIFKRIGPFLQAGESHSSCTFMFLMGIAAAMFSHCRLKDDLLPHVTGGFRGRQIRVASLDYSPWMIFERDSRGELLIKSRVVAFYFTC
jgi:hypothetical protein